MEGILLQILGFILVVSVVVFVHELGHFTVAKLFGMRVLAFSLGFGPYKTIFKKGETEYRLSLLPLGGYVQLGGESSRTGDPNDFVERPRWQRLCVVSAGVIVNAIFALCFVAVSFILGHSAAVSITAPPVVGFVVSGSPADIAGIVPGDRIVTIDGKPMRYWSDVHQAVAMSSERKIIFRITRNGKNFAIEITPRRANAKYEIGDAGILPVVPLRVAAVKSGSPAEVAGMKVGDRIHKIDGNLVLNDRQLVAYLKSHKDEAVALDVVRDGMPVHLHILSKKEGGRMGIQIDFAQSLPWQEALGASARFNAKVVVSTPGLFREVIAGERSAKGAIGGPIAIAEMSGRALRDGMGTTLFFIGLMSMSIGFINVLPIPGFDGGHIAILSVESVLGRDLPNGMKTVINIMGFVLIIFLVFFTVAIDISRIFTK